MIYNLARQKATNWDGESESFCPQCGGGLIAKRGDIKVHHWAHKQRTYFKANCFHHETEWHLAWKNAYDSIHNWQIEKRLNVNGTLFVLDAVNLETGRVREFVHSLTRGYVDKHIALANTGLSVSWLFDGDAFVSKLKEKTKKGDGYKRFLKALPLSFYLKIGGVVHYEGKLWSHWQNNIFYELESERATYVLDRYYVASTKEMCQRIQL